MRTTSPTKWLLTGALMLLNVVAVRAELLDGTKWKVQVVPSAAAAAKGEKEFADELIFADGKLLTTATLTRGYQKAAYTSEDESYEIEFEAVLVNPAEGQATWSGGVINREIKGRLEYIRKDGTKLYFNFTGTRQ